MKNIYFVGKAGSGKTYSSNYLVKKYGYKIAKFAYGVYDIAYNYFDMKGKDRNLLQVIGTDIGRQLVDTEIWVKRFIQDTFIAQKTAEKLKKPITPLVCDDCRFINEHKALKKAGWVGVYLNVSDKIRIERLGKRDGDAQINTLQHSSETGIDSFKNELIRVDASGTLKDTYNNIEAALQKIGA